MCALESGREFWGRVAPAAEASPWRLHAERPRRDAASWGIAMHAPRQTGRTPQNPCNFISNYFGRGSTARGGKYGAAIYVEAIPHMGPRVLRGATGATVNFSALHSTPRQNRRGSKTICRLAANQRVNLFLYTRRESLSPGRLSTSVAAVSRPTPAPKCRKITRCTRIVRPHERLGCPSIGGQLASSRIATVAGCVCNTHLSSSQHRMHQLNNIRHGVN